MSYTTHLWMVYTYTTYKNGDDWETVYGIVLPRRFTSQHHPRLGSRSQLSPDFHRRIAQEGAKLQGHTALLAAGNIWNPRECWPFTFWIFQDLQKNLQKHRKTPMKTMKHLLKTLGFLICFRTFLRFCSPLRSFRSWWPRLPVLGLGGLGGPGVLQDLALLIRSTELQPVLLAWQRGAAWRCVAGSKAKDVKRKWHPNDEHSNVSFFIWLYYLLSKS